MSNATPTTEMTITLSKKGDFYEVYGLEAVYVAQTLGITLTSRNGEPLAGIPYHRLDMDKAAIEDSGASVTVI